MTDIVDRLRIGSIYSDEEYDARHEAADEIERLRAERDRLREALENLVIAIGMGWDLDGVLDAARAALGEDRT